MTAMSPQEERNGIEGLHGKDFVSLLDVTPTEIEALLDLAAKMKTDRRAGRLRRSLEGKTVALLFFKPSTRTRISFEVAARELGGSALYLNTDDLQIGRGESIADTARVLSRYIHGIVIRTFEQADVELFSRWATVPVINGLTDQFHPVQALADLFTLHERFHSLRGLRLVYVGDGNNMAHSLMIGGAKMGMEVVVSTPVGYEPDAAIVDQAAQVAREQGGHVRLERDPLNAVRDAHAVYTDTWVSMGLEEESRERLRAFVGYQVNERLLSVASRDAVVMHCLPAHKGDEISEDVFESGQSVVFDQAENRLHVQKALLEALL